jgi:hypothetical protein
MTPNTVTVTFTITKEITPAEESSPTYPSARIAAVISAATEALDFRRLYGDLGPGITVTIEAAERSS